METSTKRTGEVGLFTNLAERTMYKEVSEVSEKTDNF